MVYPTRFLFLVLLCFLNMETNAQSDKFDTLENALRFNVYTDAPDSTVLPFLKNHFPYLAKHPKATGGWSIYPPGLAPVPQKGMHSLRVKRHPFIKTEHIGARIDFLTQEWTEGPSGIERTRIWIYFSNKRLADLARNYIISEFKSVGAHIDRVTKNNIEKITIKRSANEEQWDSFSLVLKKTPLTNEYSILIVFYDDDGKPW
jgi:hypothetical protein